MEQLDALGRAALKLSETVTSLEEFLQKGKEPENSGENVAEFR